MLGEEDKPDRMTNDPLIKNDECFPSNLANPFVLRNFYSAHKIFTATVLLPPFQQNTKLSLDMPLYQEVIENFFFLSIEYRHFQQMELQKTSDVIYGLQIHRLCGSFGLVVDAEIVKSLHNRCMLL